MDNNVICESAASTVEFCSQSISLHECEQAEVADENHNATHSENALLHLAVIEDNLDVSKFLLKHGVPVNSRATNKQLSLEFPVTDDEHRKHIGNDELASSIEKTTTALHLACRNESKDAVELLLQHGADVNAEMEGGETPLMIAVLSKNPKVVELLLDQGADLNARTVWGKSALHFATQTGQRVLLELMLNRGGHVNAASSEGLTPLHIATEAGDADLVALLLKSGADFRLATKSGATALHYAAVMGHKEIVELLIANGADINVIVKHGSLDLSPFSWITESEEKKTWELVARYAPKMSFVKWYGSMVLKFYRRSQERKSIFQNDAVIPAQPRN